MPNISYPQVTKEGTQGFSKVWKKGGIAILLDDTAITFATDWANVALKNFVDQQILQYQAKLKAAEEASKKSSLLVEA